MSVPEPTRDMQGKDHLLRTWATFSTLLITNHYPNFLVQDNSH